MARVLVVEDDKWSRKLVSDVLQFGGHAPIEAFDMTSAREALAEEPAPDIVLLDIQFPGGTGVELLGEIRANARTSAVPVIALTASAMAGDRERFLAQGFTSYMSKPIDVRSFCESIEAFLR